MSYAPASVRSTQVRSTAPYTPQIELTSRYDSRPDSYARHLAVVSPTVPPTTNPPTPAPQLSLLQAVVEGFVDGIVMVTPRGQVVLSNQTAQPLLKVMPDRTTPEGDWIGRLCQALGDSRQQFSQQRVVPELEVESQSGTTIRVRAQWLHPQPTPENYILLTLENRSQSFQNLAIADAQKFGFTPRETEVWALRRAGLSYQEIADKLYITHNTVKRHVKNILAKQNDQTWE